MLRSRFALILQLKNNLDVVSAKSTGCCVLPYRLLHNYLLVVVCGILFTKEPNNDGKGVVVTSWKGFSYCHKVLLFVDLVSSRQVNKVLPQTKLGFNDKTLVFVAVTIISS